MTLDLGDGLDRATVVQIQAFVSCDDVPALGSCTTDACRQLQSQLATLCPAPTGGVALARKRRPPAGLVPVTGTTSRNLKRSRRGQVGIRLKLNKTGRRLLALDSTLPVQVQVALRERRGGTLQAIFETLLRR